MLLSDRGQALDENCPKATAMQMVCDLDGDFRMGCVEDDEHGVPDELAGLIVSHEPASLSACVGGEPHSRDGVDRGAEEPEPSSLRA